MTWIEIIRKDIQQSNIDIDMSNNKTLFDELENIYKDKQNGGEKK